MITRGSGEIDWTSYDLPPKLDSSYTEFWYGRENRGYRLVMPLEFLLELVELAGQLGARGEDLAQLHERTHDVNAHRDGTTAVKNGGDHDGAVLGEGERRERGNRSVLRFTA